MSRWGILLLVAYVALGLTGRVGTSKAIRIAVWLTGTVIALVGIKYGAV